MDLNTFNSRLAKIIKDFPVIVSDNVKKTDNLAIDEVQAQLWEGEDSLGNKLQAYLNANYKQYKLSKNPKGVTDLKDTGDFWRGMYINSLIVEGNTIIIEIYSKDKKAFELTEKYGIDIWGLKDERLDEYVKELGNYVLESIYKALE